MTLGQYIDGAATKIARCPKFYAGVIVVLALLIIIVLVKIARAEAELARKRAESRMTAGIGNFEIPGNRSMWFKGALATGGLFAQDPETEAQLSAYEPQFRRSVERERNKQIARVNELKMLLHASAPHNAKKEGMHGAPCSESEYQGVDASGNRVCYSPNEENAACGNGWDPAAVAESQGLFAAQGISLDTPGEKQLRQAGAGNVYDTERGLTDAQVAQLAEDDQLAGP